jgi:hypothetical protein
MNAGGVDMESHQDTSGKTEELAKDVEESLGVNEDQVDSAGTHEDTIGQSNTSDPLYVQKRLKQQKRSHDREIREMHARMAELQSQVSPQNPQSFDANPYIPQAGGNPGSGIDETISKAVSFALQQRDMEERKAKAAEAASALSQDYQGLQHHLDSVADKYDDFDDIVRGDHAPFTPTMRDAALMLPKKGPGSAGEVLYHLGKNPEDLSRISKLLPHKQASELVALSHALISGGESKSHSSKPLGQIKNNPVTNSLGVTEKTPISTIRDRMKKGTFK